MVGVARLRRSRAFPRFAPPCDSGAIGGKSLSLVGAARLNLCLHRHANRLHGDSSLLHFGLDQEVGGPAVDIFFQSHVVFECVGLSELEAVDEDPLFAVQQDVCRIACRWPLNRPRIRVACMSEALSRVLDLRVRYEYLQAREVALAACEEDPEVSLLLELGRLEEEREDYEAAAAAFTKALAASDGAPRVRAAAGLLRARRGQGRLQEAQELATVELENTARASELLTAAGELAAELNDFALARSRLEAAVESADDGEQRAKAIAGLGSVCGMQGLLEHAEALLRGALDLAERTTGSLSIEVSVILNSLGAVLKLAGKFREAQEVFARSLSIIELAVGADAGPAATLHHNLARVLRSQRDFAGALPHARSALELHAAALGPVHIETALDKATLAAVLEGLGELAKAETLLREAVTVLEGGQSADHIEVAIQLHNLAALAARRGASSEAEALYRRSLAIRESALGPRSPGLAATLNNLAVLLKREGRVDEARELLERAVEVLDGVADDRQPVLQSARTNFAGLPPEMPR